MRSRLGAGGLILALLGAGVVEGTELRGVRVCADPDNLPFSSKDPATPGFEVELARALATDVSFYWVPTYRWPVVARHLLDRRCDLFFGLPVDPRFVDDNPRLALSRPYYVMGHVLVSRTGEGLRRMEDLQGKVVGVEAASPGDVLVTERGLRRRVFATPAEVFEALRAGDVDVAVMWSAPGGWWAKKLPGFEMAPLHYPNGHFKISVGMRKDDTQLKSAVDIIITRLLEEGKVQEILGRYGVPFITPR